MSSKKRKKRLGCIVKFGVLVLFAVIILPLLVVGFRCQIFSDVPPPESGEPNPVTAELPDYARSEDQTYLTLPEWYIVFNADEYAAFIAQNQPSQFPYFRAIGQFWRSYYEVCGVIGGRYPFNFEYQLTLAVIATSFTLENIVRGLYENTIGRLAEWLSSADPTAEELYARQVAKAYGDFIHTVPWYEFPFPETFSGLWQKTGLWGPNPIRKWERKLALSLEYGTKALYGRLLRQGAEATFAPINLETQVWASGLSTELLQAEPEVRIIQPIDEQTALAGIPRYEAFTQIVPRLTAQGVQFIDIAGNDEILITALAPSDWTYSLPDGQRLFAMPSLIEPHRQRIVVKVPVKSLHQVLNHMADHNIQLEHIYDY